MAQSWVARKIARYQRRKLLRDARSHELSVYGKTVHVLREGNQNNWA
jgi:hypothetical protein